MFLWSLRYDLWPRGPLSATRLHEAAAHGVEQITGPSHSFPKFPKQIHVDLFQSIYVQKAVYFRQFGWRSTVSPCRPTAHTATEFSNKNIHFDMFSSSGWKNPRSLLIKTRTSLVFSPQTQLSQVCWGSSFPPAVNTENPVVWSTQALISPGAARWRPWTEVCRGRDLCTSAALRQSWPQVARLHGQDCAHYEYPVTSPYGNQCGVTAQTAHAAGRHMQMARTTSLPHAADRRVTSESPSGASQTLTDWNSVKLSMFTDLFSLCFVYIQAQNYSYVS